MLSFTRLLVGAPLIASSIALASPVELTDTQLDRIAAGSADYDPGSAAQGSGGAIVGNSSTAEITTSGDVSIADGVQQGAAAVNLVNSAASGVANGVNIWDGRIESASAALQADVQQSNAILQDQSRVASVPRYARSEANVNRTVSESTETTHSGLVDTKQQILGQDIQAGMGVSIAGQLDADLTGGSIDISNNITGHFNGSITGGASNLFGDIQTGASTTIDASTEQHLTWVLPDLTLSVKGAGCYVEIGTCNSEGTYQSSSSETTITHSPFTLEDAKAEYIVVDGSTLTASETYNVALSGSAQQQSRAINLVNAAGSVVANAVNVSRAPSLETSLSLSQVNTIVQRR